jgi:hypothetical protein
VKLKITELPDAKPVKITVELPAAVHQDLLTYAEIVGSQSGQKPQDPARLLVAMGKRFMEADRAFVKMTKARLSGRPASR